MCVSLYIYKYIQDILYFLYLQFLWMYCIGYCFMIYHTKYKTNFVLIV